MSRYKLPMFHQIGSQRTGGRAGCSVFVKFPWHHTPCVSAASISKGETIGQSPLFAKKTRKFHHVHLDLCQSGTISQGHHQVKYSRGNEFRFEPRSKIFCSETEPRGKLLLVDLGSFEGSLLLSHGDALRTAILEANLHRQHTGASFLHDVHGAFLRGYNAKFRQQEPRADDRVPSEFQL